MMACGRGFDSPRLHQDTDPEMATPLEAQNSRGVLSSAPSTGCQRGDLLGAQRAAVQAKLMHAAVVRAISHNTPFGVCSLVFLHGEPAALGFDEHENARVPHLHPAAEVNRVHLWRKVRHAGQPVLLQRA
jgi:hypothetical protein